MKDTITAQELAGYLPTPSERKQAAIDKHWIDAVGDEAYEWINLRIKPDNDGWVGEIYFTPNDDTLFDTETTKLASDYSVTMFRPKSLAGLEDNAGWIAIDPDGSNLPSDGFVADVFTNRGIVMACVYYEPEKTFLRGSALLSDATHYRQIEPPKPPLY